jgi:signal transduction histidine kinase
VKIEITDNGSGIPAELRERIFEPFFTTKPEGHGLGLSFARQILKNHGGTLTYTSEVGKGTRFVAVLPIARPSHILGSVLT